MQERLMGFMTIADYSNRGAKIEFAGYLSCYYNFKKKFMIFQKGLAYSDEEAIAS